MIITSYLSWNEHINETVKKASKRLYFLVQLKRAKLPFRDLVLFYATCIISMLVYVAPVFFYALPKYLQCELEWVQKRALSIICPSLSYDEALNEAGIPTIISYCEDVCDKVFNAALGNKDNKLNKLLTEATLILIWPTTASGWEGGGGGGTSGNSWWGCAARLSTSWPCFRPKKCHFPHPFQTRSLKSIPVSRPGLYAEIKQSFLR